MDIKSISRVPDNLWPWQNLDNERPTIGVLQPCYGAGHTIYGLGTSKYNFRKVPAFPFGPLLSRYPFLRFTPFLLDMRLPLVHSWNAIPLNKDFLVSFELELPRYLGSPNDEHVVFGLKQLASSRCKGILALSEFAYKFAELRFKKYGFDELIDKMSIFRGGVPDLDPQNYMNKEGVFPLKQHDFTGVVIGTSLFRKGGMYAIEAFKRLREDEGLDVSLTLIGNFEEQCYALNPYTPSRDVWQKKALEYDWIKFTGPIPFNQIFPSLLAHDVCLSVSIDESLGWLPIEAAMMGKPVAGARVCAFPEFVHHKKTGWLIDVPLRDDGRWIGIDNAGQAKKQLNEEVFDTLVQGIMDCVRTLYNDRSLARTWGQEGRRRIQEIYGMKQAKERLEEIYNQILMLT